MDHDADRRALVTGAAGFVGSHLVRRLAADGVEVIAVTRPGGSSWGAENTAGRVRTVSVDIRDAAAVRQLLASASPSVVFHLAVARSGGAQTVLDTNVVAMAALLEAAASTGVQRIVNAGSSMEYGAAPSPHTERTTGEPTTVYGTSKLCATLLLQQWSARGAFTGVTLRPFYVYGPSEPHTRLVPRAVASALTGAELPLTVPGMTHDFVYVQDAVEAFVLAARNSALVTGEVVNICTGVATTNEELVDVVEAVTGRTVDRRVGAFPARAWDQDGLVGDPKQAETVLGWRARYSLRDGIAAVVAAEHSHDL